MNHLLIVDDEGDLRESLAEVLRSEGFTVEVAGDGNEALARATRERFDLILLDLLMPGMDGIETMLAIKRVDERPKFLIITAYATVATAVKAIQKGAADYIPKPFRVDDLVTLIRRILAEVRFEEQVKIQELDQTLSCLANTTRRRIVEMLAQTSSMRMTDITRLLSFEDRTKTMFHLRLLKEAGIIRQQDDKTYLLTDHGKKLISFMKQLMQL